jgi:hypothetical protein
MTTPFRPIRRPAVCHSISQSAKNKDPGGQEILARICHGRRTARLPEDHTWRERGKAFADGVEDLSIKNHLLLGVKAVNEALREALEL